MTSQYRIEDFDKKSQGLPIVETSSKYWIAATTKGNKSSSLSVQKLARRSKDK